MRVTNSRAYTRPAPVPKMPPGLVELMEGLTKEILRNNPSDVYEFSANYMEKLLELRDEPVTKKSLSLEEKILKAQDIVRQRAKERQDKFNRELSLSAKVTNAENSIFPILKAPVHHEQDLEQASEVEISHVPFIGKITQSVVTETIQSGNDLAEQTAATSQSTNITEVDLITRQYSNHASDVLNDEKMVISQIDSLESVENKPSDDNENNTNTEFTTSQSTNITVVGLITPQNSNHASGVLNDEKIVISQIDSLKSVENKPSDDNEKNTNTEFTKKAVELEENVLLPSSSDHLSDTVKKIESDTPLAAITDQSNEAFVDSIAEDVLISNILDLGKDLENVLSSKSEDLSKDELIFIEKPILVTSDSTHLTDRNHVINEMNDSVNVSDKSNKVNNMITTEVTQKSNNSDHLKNNISDEIKKLTVTDGSLDNNDNHYKKITDGDKERNDHTIINILDSKSNSHFSENVLIQHDEHDCQVTDKYSQKVINNISSNNVNDSKISNKNLSEETSNETVKSDTAVEIISEKIVVPDPTSRVTEEVKPAEQILERTTMYLESITATPTTEIESTERKLEQTTMSSDIITTTTTKEIESAEQKIEHNMSITNAANYEKTKSPETTMNIHQTDHNSKTTPHIMSVESSQDPTEASSNNKTDPIVLNNPVKLINCDSDVDKEKNIDQTDERDSVLEKSHVNFVQKSDSAEDNNDESNSAGELKSSQTHDNLAQSSSNNMDLETAAITIQKVFRTFMFKSRNSTFEDPGTDETQLLEDDNDRKEEYYATANMTKERRPLGITRMDTVLQTVNEEKSLSLSTDDSSTLSSAATTIQAHVRGFLVRSRYNSNRTVSTNSLVNSHEALETDTEQQKNKTILNIHIVPEESNYLSRDESVITSMDLSLDGSPISSINLHPLSYDLSERRKMLKREDAIQSISPPSNNSGKLSEDSGKDVVINETDVLVNNSTDTKINDIVANAHENFKDLYKDRPASSKDIISSESASSPITVVHTSKSEETPKTVARNAETTLTRNARSLTNMSSDESDVITPYAVSPRSTEHTSNLIHSGEFHDVVLPTKVSRGDTSVVRGE